MVRGTITLYAQNVFAGSRRVYNAEIDSKSLDADLRMYVEPCLPDRTGHSFFEGALKAIPSQRSCAETTCLREV